MRTQPTRTDRIIPRLFSWTATMPKIKVGLLFPCQIIVKGLFMNSNFGGRTFQNSFSQLQILDLFIFTFIVYLTLITAVHTWFAMWRNISPFRLN